MQLKNIKFIILVLGIIITGKAVSICPKSYKTCELIHTRPWSKDLGNQCTMAYYHCSIKTCNDTETWSEKRKICDPINCEPYEIYDHKLKCCIKSNRKLKEYKEQQEGITSQKIRLNKSLTGFVKSAGGKPIYIDDKNRKYCRNSKSMNGELCLMTYQNAKFYCKIKGKKLPSVKKFQKFTNSKNTWGYSNWSTIKIYTISPNDISGEDFIYEYEKNLILDIITYKKKLLGNQYKSEVFNGFNNGIWLDEYCHDEESIAYDKDGEPFTSTCKYFPSNGAYEYGYPPVSYAAVICEDKK